MLTTDGHLLGGRVRYRQPATGFRTGIEPVLLAASVASRPGDHILEAGTGAGAALLCLSARIPGIQAVGVEVEEATACLAAANAEANGLTNIRIITGRIETITFQHAFDHAIANPPYHGSGGSVSPVAAREIAKRGSTTLMADMDRAPERCFTRTWQPDADRAGRDGATMSGRDGRKPMSLHDRLPALAEGRPAGETCAAARTEERSHSDATDAGTCRCTSWTARSPNTRNGFWSTAPH